MPVRQLIWIDSVAAPASLTLKIFVTTGGDGGAVLQSSASTVTEGNKHAWSVTDITGGIYRLGLFTGAVKVAEMPLYTHVDIAETITLDTAAFEVVTVAAVKADTSSLLSRITANAATALANLFAMITGSGITAKYTAFALEDAPTGGGGSAALIYVPNRVVEDPRQDGRRLTFYTWEGGYTVAVRLYQADGVTPYNATGQTVELHVQRADATLEKYSGTITDTNVFSFTLPATGSFAEVATTAAQWAAWNVTSGIKKLISTGPLHVLAVPYKPT